MRERLLAGRLPAALVARRGARPRRGAPSEAMGAAGARPRWSSTASPSRRPSAAPAGRRASRRRGRERARRRASSATADGAAPRLRAGPRRARRARAPSSRRGPGLFSYQSPLGRVRRVPRLRAHHRHRLGQGHPRRVAEHRRGRASARGRALAASGSAAMLVKFCERSTIPLDVPWGELGRGAARGRPRRRGHVARRQVPGRAGVVPVARDAHLQDARARAARALPRVHARAPPATARASTPTALALPRRRAQPRRVARADGRRGARAARRARHADAAQGELARTRAAARGSGTSSGSASATSRSTGRRARSPAARRSASALTTALGTSLTGTLFVLDEPTVGLHPATCPPLAARDARARRRGQHGARASSTTRRSSARCDRVIELGPGAGPDGGQLLLRRHARGARAHGPTSPPGACSARAGARRRRDAATRREAHLDVRGARGQQPRTTSTCASRSASSCAVTGPERLGQEHARRGRRSTAALARALGRPRRRRPGPARRVRRGGARPLAPRRARRPVAARPHVARQPGDLHQGVGRAPRALRRRAGRRARGLSARRTSRSTSPARPLRGVRRRGLRDGRDAVPRRRRAPLPDLPGQALQARGARGRGSRGHSRRRRARDDRRRGARALRRTTRPIVRARSSPLRGSGSATCRSGSRSRRSRAARRSGSSSRARSAEAGAAGRSSSSTSRAPGCTREDVAHVLDGARTRSCDDGASVVVVEHDLDVIARRRLGHRSRARAAGRDGGRVVAEGTPAEVAERRDADRRGARAARPRSRTAAPRTRRRARRRARCRATIEVAHAREHNLQGRRAAASRTGSSCVVTGPERLGQDLARVRRRLRRGAAALHGDADARTRGSSSRRCRARRRRACTGVPPSIALEQRTSRARRELARSPRSPRSRTTCACSTPRSASRTARRATRAVAPELAGRALRAARARRRGAAVDAARARGARAQGHVPRPLHRRGARRRAARRASTAPSSRSTRRRSSPKTKEHTIDLIVYVRASSRRSTAATFDRALALGQRRGAARPRPAQARGETLLSDGAHAARAAAPACPSSTRAGSRSTPSRAAARRARAPGVEGGPAALGEGERHGPCRACAGTRLAPRAARACASPGERYPEVVQRARWRARSRVARRLALRGRRARASPTRRTRELRPPARRSSSEVGLGYLALDRARGDALRRRDAAPAPRGAARERAHRRALRARRADHRPAPARHRAPAREPARARRHGLARCSWSSTTPRPSAPPTTSSTSAPAAAATAATSSPRARRRDGARRSAARRPRARSRARRSARSADAPAARDAWHRARPARAPTTCAT